MDLRVALKPKSEIQLCNKNGDTSLYTVEKELGRGGSCIVYEVSLMTNVDVPKLYRIKECYPHKLHIKRKDNGVLDVSAEDEMRFAEQQNKMIEDFRIANSLFYLDGTQGMMTDQLEIYRGNNTIYIVSAYSSEKTLSTYMPASIKECTELVRQLAYVIDKLHQQGYLYLDIKPDNVLVIENLQSRIQLFDFDSLVSIFEIHNRDDLKCTDIRLSYSRGFAPIELRLAKLKELGPHTDVFGIGALLFYLLFGNAPTAMDCDHDAEYDFKNIKFVSEYCDDKLFSSLSDFFHNTLASYYPDRYQHMQLVIKSLSEIIKYADVTLPRIFSTKDYMMTYIVGREKEFEQINRFIDDVEYNCLFITGIGGIGKSTLVKGYLQQSQQRFDTVLYMQFSGSMESTIADDNNILVNTISQYEHISSKGRYFDKKIQKIRKLVKNTSTVIVIDNFSGEIDDDVLEVLKTDWKVIIVSRQAPAYHKCCELLVHSISDRYILRQIFEEYLDQVISTSELPYFDDIVENVKGHTYALELIARQIKNNYNLTIEKAAMLSKEHGFSAIAPEKIRYEKDGRTNWDTIGNIIDALFDASNLSEDKKVILEMFSLIGIEGMDINKYQEIFQLESKDDINELVSDGWLVLYEKKISMHPVIQEAVHRWKWEDKFEEVTTILLKYYLLEIAITSRNNNYPKKLYRNIIISQSRIDTLREQSKSKCLLTLYDRFMDKCFNYGIYGDLYKKRISSLINYEEIDYNQLDANIREAEMILRQCNRKEEIRKLDIYTNLLFVTVLNMPKYREDYIISQSRGIITGEASDFVFKGFFELDNDNKSRNPITHMKLYRMIVSLYVRKGLTEEAKKILSKAECLAKKARKRWVYALFYDMYTDYLDYEIGGDYREKSERKKEQLKEFFKYLNTTLRYSKGVATDDTHIYAKNLLRKADVLMKSGCRKNRTVDRNIGMAEDYIAANTLKYADVRLQYYIIRARYYAFMEGNMEGTDASIYWAMKISEIVDVTDLHRIDNTIVPCANIYLEIGCYEKALKLLNEGVKLCLEHDALEVYSCRLNELCVSLCEVANKTQEPDRFLPAIKIISSDTDNQTKKVLSNALGVLCHVSNDK